MKIAKVKIVKNDYDEFQVKAYDANGGRMPNCDYFTDDRQDAKDTARVMLKPELLYPKVDITIE